MIVSCLLTRKCNLSCHYCRISKDYDTRPKEYPDFSYFLQNEKSPDWWFNTIQYINNNVENAFFLLYGGEPTIYQGFEELVRKLYENRIEFSVITNASFPDKILNMLDYLPGLTCSVDPGALNADRSQKTLDGLNLISEVKRLKPDVDCVAEVVFDSTNTCEPKIVNLLENAYTIGYRTSLTIIETDLNPYYDFATSVDEYLLKPEQIELLRNIIRKCLNDKRFNKVILNPEAILYILENGPIVKCNLQSMNYLNIDTDGSMRLCLRIGGVRSREVNIENYWNRPWDEFKNDYLIKAAQDLKYCEGCSWTCAFMTKSCFTGYNSKE